VSIEVKRWHSTQSTVHDCITTWYYVLLQELFRVIYECLLRNVTCCCLLYIVWLLLRPKEVYVRFKSIRYCAKKDRCVMHIIICN